MWRQRQRHEGRAHALANIRVSHRHTIGEPLKFSTGLVNAHTRLQSCDTQHVAIVSVAQHPLFHAVQNRLLHIGHPQVKRGNRHRSMKCWRRNPYDGQLVLVDADGLADDLRIRAEMRAPVTIADDGHRKSSRRIAVLRWRENPACFRLDAQHREKIARHQLAPNPLGVLVPANAYS